MAPAPRPRPHRPRQLTRAYWHNHRSQLFCLAAYAGLHVLLFALAAGAHRHLGASIMVAKGCGQCLNFDCSFIAVGSASIQCSENVRSRSGLLLDRATHRGHLKCQGMVTP